MLRRTKRPDGNPISIRRRRPWPRLITYNETRVHRSHTAAIEKIVEEFYSSDVWNNHVTMRFDMLAMSLASENETRRRIKRLTCSMCGKVVERYKSMAETLERGRGWACLLRLA